MNCINNEIGSGSGIEFENLETKEDNQLLDISLYSLNYTYINSRECPYCSSHNVVSKGNYKGRKRYQCRTCGKSYNDLTNTPFSGVHNLKKLTKYLSCMINGDSIRKAAKITNISINTSFNWRHRLLDGIKRLPSPKMKNVKEILEVEIPYSSKGQRTRTSECMQNTKVSTVFICDRLGKVDSDSILSSQKGNNPIFKRIREKTNEHCDIINSPKFINKNFNQYTHVKNSYSSYSKPSIINAVVVIWYSWMKRFRGVATKYLSNYLHWFDFLDNTGFDVDKIPDFVSLLLKH